MTRFTFGAVILVASGCGQPDPAPPPPDLSAWRVDRAGPDADADVARGDVHLLGMNGVGPYTPGIDGGPGWPTVGGVAVPTECIGGSDAVEPGQLPLIRAMEAYATAYNRRVAADVRLTRRRP